MKRVKVITVGESVQATERSYLEFSYYNPPEILTEIIGEHDVVIDTKVQLAPVHRICEVGKPDILLAIEPKLYDLITDIKIKDLNSSLGCEQHYRKQLEKDINFLMLVKGGLEEDLSLQNSRICDFNDLPWYKRIFRKV